MEQQPERQWNHTVRLRPASVEEAGLFYPQVDEDLDWQTGTVGHVRMDFGHEGKEFWHTWWPHNQNQFNTPEFKEALQNVVDALRRDGPLKDLSAMRSYCQQHGGAITEDGENFGYIAETEHYQFCLRCTPIPGHYQGYLYCYDKRQQEMAQHDTVVGRVTYVDGTRQEFTDSELYLKTIKEELPYRNTTGFRYETLTEDPQIRKAVDDIILDLSGEENPRRACSYGLTEKGMQMLRDVADPSLPHTYAWFVMTDYNTPQEQLCRNLTLEEAMELYQNSVLPPEPQTLKFYMPLTAQLYGRDDWGDLEEYGNDLNGRDLRDYQSRIHEALLKSQMPEGKSRGLMHWYDKQDGVNEKVQSIVFDAESRDGQLWCVAECKVVGELLPEETEALADYISGQASDGWGENFKQRAIDLEEGELYVSLWNTDSWSIQTEEAKFSPDSLTRLPDMCWSVLPSEGTLICIKRGEHGYFPSDWSTGDRAQNRYLADYNNQRRGITPAQEQAMLTGSMCGWDVPGADPKWYEDKQQEMGGMTLGPLLCGQ